jgi:hypothetical protein
MKKVGLWRTTYPDWLHVKHLIPTIYKDLTVIEVVATIDSKEINILSNIDKLNVS